MASTHLANIRELFEEYDVNHDGKLTLNELNDLLTNVARKITALPAVGILITVLSGAIFSFNTLLWTANRRPK